MEQAQQCHDTHLHQGQVVLKSDGRGRRVLSTCRRVVTCFRSRPVHCWPATDTMTSPERTMPDCCAQPPLIVLARHLPSVLEALYVKPSATLGAVEEVEDVELTSLAATLATLPMDSLDPC